MVSCRSFETTVGRNLIQSKTANTDSDCAFFEFLTDSTTFSSSNLNIFIFYNRCMVCKSNYFLTSTNHCLPSISNCVTHDLARSGITASTTGTTSLQYQTFCKECEAGYELDADNKKCIEISANFIKLAECAQYKRVGDDYVCAKCVNPNAALAKVQNRTYRCFQQYALKNCDQIDEQAFYDEGLIKCKYCSDVGG